MTHYRSILFGFLVVLATLTGSLARAACEEKYAFDQIRAETKELFNTGTPLTQSQNQRFVIALGKLNSVDFLPALTTHNQAIHATFLNGMLKSLNILQRSGRRDMIVLSRKNMEKAGQVFEELCESVTRAVGAPQAGDQRSIFERLKFSFTNPFRGGSARDARSMMNLSLVFFFLLGLISLIVFCWKAYVLAFPFLKNRKSCEIKTTLKVLDLEVAGHITILGAAGSRFVPLDIEQSAKLIDFLRSLSTLPTSSIAIRGFQFDVNLHMISTGFCVTMFKTSLDRATLNRLFFYSQVPTHFISKTAIHSNLHTINPKFA